MTSEPWIDRLRVWAALAVIALHVSGFSFRAYAGTWSGRWLDGNFWNSGTRWAVPVYVVLSGYLLLRPERREGAAAFWRRRAARVGIPLLFWATAYALYHGERTAAGLARTVLVRLDASYHLWFLYMLVVLYAAAPLVRWLLDRLAPPARLALCATCFALTLRLPDLPTLFPVAILPRWLELAAPYAGYFVLGGVWSRRPAGRRVLLPALVAAAAFVVTVGGTAALVLSRGEVGAGRVLQDAASPNVIALALALCLAARNAGERFPGRRLEHLAPAVLGVYLIHPLLIDALWAVGLPLERFPPPLGVPLLSAVVAALSFAAALALRRLPLLRRTV